MIRIEYAQVTRFGRQLAQVPTELRRELRPRIRSAADKVSARIRSNASWSTRIPGAVRTKVSFRSGGSGGVNVFVDAGAAPHARPLEFGSSGGGNVNRHPVFGDREVWVDQPTRPFFMKSIAESEPMVVREIQSAIDQVLGRVER